MHLGLDVAAALVHVEIHRYFAIVLQREEEMIGIHHPHRGVDLDVARHHRAGARLPDLEHGLVGMLVEHQRQRLQALHDLVHVLEHAGHGLVLVHHAVEPERPHRGAAERGQQHPAKRVAQGVTEPALQRLEAELGEIRVVVPLGHFDQVRADHSGQINRHRVVRRLLRVQLDDQLFLGVERDLLAAGRFGELAGGLVEVRRRARTSARRGARIPSPP